MSDAAAEGDGLPVEISRVDPTLPLPAYATDGSAGVDLYSRLAVSIPVGGIALIPSNVIARIPAGYVMIVALRSSTPMRKGLIMPNGIGVIDGDFHGPEDEVQIQVMNVTQEPAHVARGERIAQAVIVPLSRARWVEVDPSDRPTRGGFGSTG